MAATVAEACEVWNYAGCVEQESNPRIKALWERFLDSEALDSA